MNLGYKLFFATATLVVGGAIVYRVVHGPQRLRAPKFLDGDKGLKGIYDADATVAPEVLEQLHPVIDDEELSSRVVNLSTKTQVQVYELSRRLWMDTGFDGDKEDLARDVLANVTPQTSWHVKREDLPENSARARVWDGVITIIDIMGASAEEEAREFDEKAAVGGAP